MVAHDVFKQLTLRKNAEMNYTVSASFFEIYGNLVFDLLAKKQRLRVLEDGKQQVQVVGLTEKVVTKVILICNKCNFDHVLKSRTYK